MATANLNPKTEPEHDTKSRKPVEGMVQPVAKLSKRWRSVRRKVYERYEDMRSYQDRLDAESDWEYADQQYEQYEAAVDERDWRAHLNLPDAWAAIQAQAQETIERKSRPKLQRVEDSDKAQEEFQNSIMTHNMDKTGFDYQYFLAKLVASYRGTAHLWDFYRLERRMVKFPTGIDKETGEITYEKKEITDWDDDYAMFIENEYVLTDDAATDDDDMIDCIRREILEIEEFHRIYDDKEDFENQEQVFPGGETSTRSFFKLPDDIREQDVEVLHYHNRSTDEYLVCANNVPIHDGPLQSTHKELPLITVYQYRRPGRYWGMGIPKVIKSLTEERKAIRHLKLDRNKLDLQKMFLHNKAFDLDDEDLAPRPHGLIGVDTNGLPLRDVIQPIEYGQQGVGESFTTEEVLLEDIRRATGIDDRIQGVDKGGTATEAAILKESSLKRLNMLMILNEMDTLVRVGRIKWANLQFHYPTPRMERIVMPNGDIKEKAKTRKISVNGKSFGLKQSPDDKNKNELVMTEIPGRSVVDLNSSMARYMEGEVDVIMTAEPSLGNSKAIKQAKVTEMLTTVSQVPEWLAQLEPRKSMEQILDINDLDPDNWLAGTGMTAAEMRQLASAELKIMQRGIALEPTPDATEEHILQEMAFARGDDFKQLPEDIQEIIEEHILGELEAQGGLQGAVASSGIGAGQAQSVVEGGAAPNVQAQNSGGNQPQTADIQPTRQGPNE